MPKLLVPLSEIASRYKIAGNGCWEYTGSINVNGYGVAAHRAEGERGSRTHVAHRLAYKYHCGPIPKGHVVMHVCDNPPCINPAHLRVGTYAENMRDMVEKGRHRSSKRYPSATG